MNSIEFIDELIKNIETNIYITESVLKTYEDSDDEEEINTLKNNLEYLKERLKYSKQIKTEIEAWEVVEEGIEYEEDIPCDERPEYTYKFKKWKFKLTEDDYNFEEKDKKLKKALEIKDE